MNIGTLKNFTSKVVRYTTMRKILVLVSTFLLITLVYVRVSHTPSVASPLESFLGTNVSPTPTLTPSPTPLPIPEAKLLVNDYHIFQTFNNCGPAALSMALSYFGLEVSQKDLGEVLRPYQNPQGNNDDKSVTLEEIARKSKEYGLTPYLRPNGDKEVIKKFIASDIPVITRTLLKEGDDIGHFRVIKGYDNATGEFTQDDSLQGHNLTYSYDEFMNLWKPYAYEYLVLIPSGKDDIAKSIIGENIDEQMAWQTAIDNARSVLATDPTDMYARLNLSVGLYHTGDYEGAIREFETVETRLPFRTLWYQIEPIMAYYKSGSYDEALSRIEKILSNQNRAYSELYIIRGKIYENQGKSDEARAEYDKALVYNKNIDINEALN